MKEFITHVAIKREGYGRTLKFYQDALGFEKFLR